MTDLTTVTAIVVNWESAEQTLSTVGDLRSQTHSPLETLVVDNGSADASLAHLRSGIEGFPDVSLHALDENRGFAGGVNAGLRRLEDDVEAVFLCNPDVRLPDSTTVHGLVETLETHSTARVVTPVVERSDGELWFIKGVVEDDSGKVAHSLPCPSDDPLIENGYVPFAAALVDVDSLRQFDGLPERYFLYYEDVDFCTALREQGYDVLTDTSERVRHQVSASTDHGDGSPTKAYYRTRNHLLFARERTPRRPFWCSFSKRLLREMVTHGRQRNPACVRAMVEGFWAGITSESGEGPYPR